MNRSRRQQKQSIIDKYKAAISCKRKKRYSQEEAWNKAELNYIQRGIITLPYRCVHGHWHLTGKASVGDCSHLPEYYRELFATYNQPLTVSFWRKLRRFLGVSN